MSITKNTTYSGTISDSFAMFRSFSIRKETQEVIEGNTRRQEDTGGLVATATFDVAGDDIQVEATVTAAQVKTMTMEQMLTAATNLLKTKLGV